MESSASNELPRNREELCPRGATHVSNGQQAQNANSMLSPGEHALLSDQNARLNGARGPRFTTPASLRSPPGMAHSHPPTDGFAEDRHSFGLHISRGNVSCRSSDMLNND